MSSVYDISAVTVFAIMVLAFIFLTDRQPRTMSQLLVAGVALALANYLGNAGFDILAGALLIAAAVYAILIVRARPA